MNIFVVHSGDDFDRANEIKEKIEHGEPRANVLILNTDPNNNLRFWKHEARKLLKQTQIVLFVVGEESCKSDNIKWELDQALKMNKQVLIYKLDESYEIHPCLYGADRFSKRETIRGEEVKSERGVIERVKSYEDQDYNVFNNLDPVNREELLEQYKIFLDTSERLVERRQSVNSFYLTANAALLTAATAIIAALSEPSERAAIACVIGFIGLILSSSWHGVLESYGILNSSKLRIISIIEERMPVSLYDAEWQAMSDKLNSKKYVSFTDSEKRAPKIFGVLYGIAFVFSLFYVIPMVFNWLVALVASF